jgi:hypothetical protein
VSIFGDGVESGVEVGSGGCGLVVLRVVGSSCGHGRVGGLIEWDLA